MLTIFTAELAVAVGTGDQNPMAGAKKTARVGELFQEVCVDFVNKVFLFSGNLAEEQLQQGLSKPQLTKARAIFRRNKALNHARSFLESSAATTSSSLCAHALSQLGRQPTGSSAVYKVFQERLGPIFFARQ